MSTQIIRDQNGNRIGEIEIESDGRQVARDINRNRIGTYDPKLDATYNENFERISGGNTLSSLIMAPQQNNNLLWGAGGFLLGRLTSGTKSTPPEKEIVYVPRYETPEEPQKKEPSEEQKNREPLEVKVLNESEPAIVKWGDKIDSLMDLSEGFFVLSKGQRNERRLYFPELVSEAWPLWVSESWREAIEDDYHLTEEQRAFLLKLWDKQRNKLLEKQQFKETHKDPEKAKSQEALYKKRMAEVFEHLKKVGKKGNTREFLKQPAHWNPRAGMLTPYDEMEGTLQYEPDLTEAQKTELRQLIGSYRNEINKLPDKVEPPLTNNNEKQ